MAMADSGGVAAGIMTVKELVEALQAMPPEAVVVATVPFDDGAAESTGAVSHVRERQGPAVARQVEVVALEEED